VRDDGPGPAIRRRRALADSRRVIWAATLGGLVLRMMFGLGYWTGKPLTHDEREYLLLASNVAAGRGFGYSLPDGSAAPGEHFGRAPLYPLMIAGVLAVTDPGPAAWESLVDPIRSAAHPSLPLLKILQAMLGAAMIWLIALLADRAGGPRAARAAAIVAAIYPPLVWIPAYVFSETLYAWLAWASVWVLSCAVPARTSRTDACDDRLSAWWLALVAGALAGLSILTRPAVLAFLPLAVLWLGWRRAGLACAGLIVGTALVVAPWTARNVATYGRFVLVASEGGITFWTGNNPFATGEGDMAANPDIKRANLALRAAHPGLSPEALEPIYYQEALAFIRQHPASWAGLMARKLFYTVVPIGPSYRLHSTLYHGVSVVSYLLVLPFAVAGLVPIWRRATGPVALWLLAASSVLVCVVFFPQERFRIPVVDPTLVVCAASWWALRPDPAATPGLELRERTF
jgi:4-amino-4-deoxy-L-arabinose transferase-like glycosyltransferase